MIHYYNRSERRKDLSEVYTYCGLIAADVHNDRHNQVDCVVINIDLRSKMCPTCAEHPDVQMQILEAVEL